MSQVHATLDELIGLRLRARELASGVRRRAHEPRGGTLHSPFRGRGMEYAESRPYSAGDDVRHVDWRVTARSGQLHSKLFHAERERVSAVVMDASPAMAFGTRGCFKSVQAARLAALFAWLALGEGDRLAGVACGASAADMPVTGGRRGVLRLLDHLIAWQPAPAPATLQAAADGGLADALQRLERVLRPGSHVLLTLDASSIDEASARVLSRLSRHHDVLACVLADALECEPLPPGRYPISDGQHRAWLHIADVAQAEALRQRLSAPRLKALEMLKWANVRAHAVRTDHDPVLALRDLLRGVIKTDQAA